MRGVLEIVFFKNLERSFGFCIPFQIFGNNINGYLKIFREKNNTTKSV